MSKKRRKQKIVKSNLCCKKDSRTKKERKKRKGKKRKANDTHKKKKQESSQHPQSLNFCMHDAGLPVAATAVHHPHVRAGRCTRGFLSFGPLTSDNLISAHCKFVNCSFVWLYRDCSSGRRMTRSAPARSISAPPAAAAAAAAPSSSSSRRTHAIGKPEYGPTREDTISI